MNRRDFLRDSAVTTLSLTMGMVAEELFADEAGQAAPPGPPVGCAVIGLGKQGREMLQSLSKMTGAPVPAICDTYKAPAFLKHATDLAPEATVFDDYRRVLDNKSVQAVFIATPSHLHRQIALDALQAGKHVYCEAPLATDLAEARDIAKAGLAAKTVFQSGLQNRSNKQHNHVLGFVRSDALGHLCSGRAQWHTKESWRQPAPTDEREHELNWRLYKATSTGLPGERSIQQLDTATWFLKSRPVAATGFGSIMFWKDTGMEVPDTVQCVIEYPNNVRYSYDGTLVDSFDGAYDLLMGSNSAVLMREQRAWMFKETDSPLLGWEVYARKDKLSIGDQMTASGIALVADATKLLAQGKDPGQVGTDVTKTMLYQAMDAYLDCIRSNKKPPAGPAEGFEATVISHKVHEATLGNTRIEFDKAWFDLS